eukprot:GHUV01010816.1.p1 GENE.GHUV01010816.1~~GHUV01010816.1.p1  ORF type:complete len:366 (+),score=86.52 GHUV01010816.1:252-1349(+)
MTDGTDAKPSTSYGHLHLQAICKGHKNGVTGVQFSPTDDVVATASADTSVKLWKLQDGSETGPSSSMNHEAGINAVAWNPQGNYVLTASDDKTAKIWDVETAACLCTLENHTHYVFCCQFNPQGNVLVTGSFDETICFWDVRTARCIRVLPAHSDPITCMDFSYDGTVLASCSYDGLVRLWDTHSGHCLKTLAVDNGSSPLSCVKFSPNGQYLLQASLNSKVRLVNYQNGKVVKTYTGHKNNTFTSDMTFVTQIGGRPSITAGSEDGGIVCWDVNSRQIVHRIEGTFQEEVPAEDPTAMDVDADTAAVAAVVAVKHADTSDEAATGHRAPVLCVSAHPSKPFLASAANDPDCTVKIWSAVKPDPQ